MRNYLKHKNFILLGSNPEDLKAKAHSTVHEVRRFFPDQFNSDESFFSYELRYVPPFDKGFCELKRLQGTAADKAGFQDEYRGYIVMDVSRYLKHELEDYFDITVKFLHDRNEFWRYVFLVDNTNSKAALDLVRKILSILYCHVIDCREEDIGNRQFIEDACKAHCLFCTDEVLSFFEAILGEKDYSRNTVSGIITDLSATLNSNEVINMALMREYLASDDSVLKYMMTAENLNKLVDLLNTKSVKGLDYGEKV